MHGQGQHWLCLFPKKLLETDSDLDFLSKLSKSELETLVAAVRNQVEN